MPGITTSSNTSTGCTRRATSMALSPLRVTNNLYPRPSSVCRKTSRFVASSSTSRMRSASSAIGAWLVFMRPRISRFLLRRRLELAPDLVEAHGHRHAGANQVGAHVGRRTPPSGRWTRCCEERPKSGEEVGRQYRLEVLERSAPHVGVVSAESSCRDSHWLPLQGKREQIEDVFSDQVGRGIAIELSFNERESGGDRLQKFGVLVCECQHGAAAAESKFKVGFLESGQQ